MKTLYIETSIVSYLTARPSRDLLAAAWQEATLEWWEEEGRHYGLFTSELVLAEAGAGDPVAARARLDALGGVPILSAPDEAQALAARLAVEAGIPSADALHIAIAAVHGMDYLLTWNCRHIDNPATKPAVRSLCAVAGYPCPEICTPLELLPEEG